MLEKQEENLRLLFVLCTYSFTSSVSSLQFPQKFPEIGQTTDRKTAWTNLHNVTGSLAILVKSNTHEVWSLSLGLVF